MIGVRLAIRAALSAALALALARARAPAVPHLRDDRGIAITPPPAQRCDS